MVCMLFSEVEELLDSDGQHPYFMPEARDWLYPPDMVDDDWFNLGQAELENALKVGIKKHYVQEALCKAI